MSDVADSRAEVWSFLRDVWPLHVVVVLIGVMMYAAVTVVEPLAARVYVFLLGATVGSYLSLLWLSIYLIRNQDAVADAIEEGDPA